MGSILTGYLDSLPEEIRNPLAEFKKDTERAKQESIEQNVNSPKHYGGEGNVYEVINVIEAYGMGHDFCLGNCLKYFLRAGKKTECPLEDLKKAQWYLNRLITQWENK